MKYFQLLLLSCLCLTACDHFDSAKTKLLSTSSNSDFGDKPECKLYEPVCGSDNITYPNLCAAHTAVIDIAYKGECNTVDRCKTDPVCGVLIDCPTNGPVCGTDGKSYINEQSAKSLGVSIAYRRKCFSESKFENCELICQGPPSEKESMCADDGFRYPSECWAATLGKQKVDSQDCKEGSFDCFKDDKCIDGTPCKKSGLACPAYDKEKLKTNPLILSYKQSTFLQAQPVADTLILKGLSTLQV